MVPPVSRMVAWSSEDAKTIVVPVNAQSVTGTSANFFLNLTGPSNAVIIDGQGQGTILGPPPRVQSVAVNDGAAQRSRVTSLKVTFSAQVSFVTTPGGPQPDGAFGYGAGFWLLNKSEGIPVDAFGAFGNRGQYVIIIPSRALVIVRQGYDDDKNRLDIAQLVKAVVAADR